MRKKRDKNGFYGGAFLEALYPRLAGDALREGLRGCLGLPQLEEVARDIDGLLQNSENQDGIDLRDSIANLTVSNVIGNSDGAVSVNGYLCDSAFSNIVNKNPAAPVVSVKMKDGMRNVSLSGLVTTGKETVLYRNL